VNDLRHTTTRSIGVVLLWLCALTTLVAAVMAATGGFTYEFAGLRLSMHAVTRPIVAALALGVCSISALGAADALDEFDRLQTKLSRRGLPIAIAFAAVIGVATFAAGAQIAGGADSSGYLSQAKLWRAANLWDIRRLQSTTPLAHELTLTNRQYPFTPLGYRPASAPGVIVPGYPPGLPLQFAIAQLAGGDRAQFAVVPLSAAGLVIVAFLIGRRLGGADAALIAAAAVGGSPILLYQAAQPMSDVPAAFWWSLAILCLMQGSRAFAAAAGVAAAIACAVRPNLFVMAPLIALLAWWWNGWRRSALIEAACFAVPIAVAAAAFAVLQQTLYGAASTSGYGEIASLFSAAHIWPNLVRYPRWAIFAQSGLIVLAIAAPLAIRRGWVATAVDRVVASRVAWSGVLFFGSLQAFYLLYIAFDDWVYFRFLLPALPWVLALEAVSIAAVCGRVPAAMRGLAVILVAVLIASWGVGRARGLGAFRLQDSEQRYLGVADFARGLPPNAVFISLQHSGSLAYYGQSAILRWDWLEPDEIDRAVAELARQGHPVFAVLDDWEETQFRSRFAGTHTVDALRTPVFETGGPPAITARVFALGGTTTDAAAAPVSSRPLLALRIQRTPAGPIHEPGSASCCLPRRDAATRSCDVRHSPSRCAPGT